MNWTHFLLWLAGIYSLYYITVILLDLATNKRGSKSGSSSELTFSEQVAPVRLGGATETKSDSGKAPVKQVASEVIGSGGVPITDLFRLAKQEAIIYTRSVSF